MRPDARPIPNFKVWCPECNSTNVKRTDADDQGQYLFMKYKCQECGCMWTSSYERQGWKEEGNRIPYNGR